MQKNKTLNTFILLSTFPALIPTGVLAVSKSYIEAVKLDVSEFETKTWIQQPDSEWFPSSQNFSAGRSDSVEIFKAYLKDRLPGSYLLFNKLDEGDQNQVWRSYNKTGDLGGIRSDIYSLWKQARRNSLKKY